MVHRVPVAQHIIFYKHIAGNMRHAVDVERQRAVVGRELDLEQRGRELGVLHAWVQRAGFEQSDGAGGAWGEEERDEEERADGRHERERRGARRRRWWCRARHGGRLVWHGKLQKRSERVWLLALWVVGERE